VLAVPRVIEDRTVIIFSSSDGAPLFVPRVLQLRPPSYHPVMLAPVVPRVFRSPNYHPVMLAPERFRFASLLPWLREITGPIEGPSVDAEYADVADVD
jgi:hypothetical protein